jgi:hypothetical protein
LASSFKGHHNAKSMVKSEKLRSKLGPEKEETLGMLKWFAECLLSMLKVQSSFFLSVLLRSKSLIP